MLVDPVIAPVLDLVPVTVDDPEAVAAAGTEGMFIPEALLRVPEKNRP